MAYLADTYSRGWGHITTRQNIQFHFVQLDDRCPRSCGSSAAVGHDQPRGLRRHGPQRHGLPPRRRLPARGARRHAVGRGGVPTLRPQPAGPAPAAQVQDQLLRLRHRLRPGDVQRRRRRRRHPHAATTARSSAASGCSSPAGSAPTRTPRWRSRSSPPRKTCCPRIEAILRVFEQPRQPRQQAAGPHEVAGRHARLGGGAGAASSRSGACCSASSSWPGGIPAEVEKAGDAPAGVAADVTPHRARSGHAR